MSVKPRAASRIRPQLAWQLPTLCLSILVGVGLLMGAPATYRPMPLATGITMLAVLLVASCMVRWAEVPHSRQIVVPLLSVVAAVLIEVHTVSLMPAVVLVGAVPALWLVFEFGPVGTSLAVLSVAVHMCVAHLGGVFLPTSGMAWAQFAMLPTFAVSLCFGVHHVAGRLRRERKVLEEQSALLESTLELAHDQLLVVQAVLDAVDAAIIGYDQDGEVVLENTYADGLASLAGVRLSDPPGDAPAHFYREDRVTLVPAEELVGAQATQGKEVAPQTYWVGPPGDQVAVMVSARQIYRPNGDRLGAVVVGWDVSDIVEAVRVREEFLTTVSHELRTPLTSIIGYQELIAEELQPEQSGIAAMLAIAQRNAGVLLSRVSQLLQASGAEGPELRVRPVDVSALLHDAAAKHRTVAADAGVHLSVDAEPEVSAHLDPDAWEQVVDNLVSNAIKYSARDDRVQVSLERSGDAFALRVVDTGIGMSRTEQQRAFERFYRTTAARDQAIQGLGVGLSIVQEIVEAHHGQVSLSSAPGRGTVVTVQLPLCPVPATA